uniref:Uncharacterized protein n=1 Tax=Aplanochytrium stocchinoi TaxID=215587 RepID=A0A7S3LMW1_9STRA|mmetsp:Transcript_1443/g.1729  ORF Transcript_1443/g.1729 Transcript_1443/m.1729 type:complete len:355 (+) Transcript_1443:161-1225(+)|eukprot:CAMPEP_0204830900 /NCGR_PEP_ID=MMETSP1346-20131115/9473_1 /ASSEMBLY_ACC=CAM_ASM_000771 /TAXON_ID=215587 /ORGANISM="Aplanochytrium stocchinoi, Strain GSBS06" /LENGTH=354 /DNA_ID=CAMNT_0051961511 /DNA_START=158 /DNA_END=1222 /DNA_ORIENTATION=-
MADVDDLPQEEVDYDGGRSKGHKPKLELKAPDLGQAQQMLKDNLRNILPAIMKAEHYIEVGIHVARPYVKEGLKYYKEFLEIIEPYGANEVFKCITGFAMMFFGGFFITTVAVYEAIIQGGQERFATNMKLLGDQFQSIKQENKKDDQEDLDGDGIADVLQISAEQYTMRKMMVVFRACDPTIVQEAGHSLYTMFIAVAATLRLQFARTISLGASLGDQLGKPYVKYVVPQIEEYTDPDMHKWLEPIGLYACRMAGVFIAFQVQRIISTVHTAVKGARVFTEGLTELSQRNGYGYLTEGYLDEALSVILAIVGIYLQLFAWSTLPFPVKLAFFPAFLVEKILGLFVSVALTASG